VELLQHRKREFMKESLELFVKRKGVPHENWRTINAGIKALIGDLDHLDRMGKEQ